MSNHFERVWTTLNGGQRGNPPALSTHFAATGFHPDKLMSTPRVRPIGGRKPEFAEFPLGRNSLMWTFLPNKGSSIGINRQNGSSA